MNNQQKASRARRLGTVGNLKLLQQQQEDQLKIFRNSKTIEQFEILRTIETKIKTNLKNNYEDPEKQELYKAEFEKSGTPKFYLLKGFNKLSVASMTDKQLEPKEIDLTSFESFDDSSAFGEKQGTTQEIEVDPLLKKNIQEEKATVIIEKIKNYTPNKEFEKKLESGDNNKYQELLAESNRLAKELLSNSGYKGTPEQGKQNIEIFSKYYLQNLYFSLDEGVRETIEKDAEEQVKQSNIAKAEIKERLEKEKEINSGMEKQEQLKNKASEEIKILSSKKVRGIDALITQLEENHAEKYLELSSKANNQIQENYGEVISSLPEATVDKLYMKYMNHFIAEDGVVLGVDNDFGHNLRGQQKPVEQTIEPVEEIFNIVEPTPLQPDKTQTEAPDKVQTGLIEADIETDYIPTQNIQQTITKPLIEKPDFKNKILDQLEPQTETAQRLLEDKKIRSYDIETLKSEIRSFHLIYDDEIKALREPQHKEDLKKALASNDIEIVRNHNKIMRDYVRKYYKYADLRIGVVMSAESLFGQSVSNLISGHLQTGSGGFPSALDKLLPTGMVRSGNQTITKKGVKKLSSAVTGNVSIRRGGVNTHKAINKYIPKSAPDLTPQQLGQFEPVVDAPYPYVFRTGIRARRQIRNPELVLKTKK